MQKARLYTYRGEMSDVEPRPHLQTRLGNVSLTTLLKQLMKTRFVVNLTDPTKLDLMEKSNLYLVEFICLDDRVGPCYGITSGSPVVERAIVLVVVPMQ